MIFSLTHRALPPQPFTRSIESSLPLISIHKQYNFKSHILEGRRPMNFWIAVKVDVGALKWFALKNTA
jgi:hypothetical protein